LRSLGEQMRDSAAPAGKRGASGGRLVRGVRRAGAASFGRRKIGRRTKTLLAAGVAVVVLVGAAGGYLVYLNGRIHRIKVGALTSTHTSGAENILLVGSTSRCALKHQSIAYGLCSAGVTGVNSDVVMILHLNAARHLVSILSIPRDLFVPNARTTGANKIDAALAQSPTQLVTAVEQDFAIPIQHYVELNFDSFAAVVDALGGINMYFPEPVFDDFSGLTVTSPGCVHLNGVRALQVVRARHLQYQGPGVTSSNYFSWPQEGESDLARIRRDHEFLRVLATAVARQGLANPLTDGRIIAGVAPRLTVDDGLSVSHMVNLVLTFHRVNVGAAPQLTVPVMASSSLHYYYKGGDYGNIEFPSQPQDQQVTDSVLGVNAATDTMTGKALPKPASVTVSVLNGTGAPNQAIETATALHALGFHTVGVGDAAPVGPESETVVYYAGPKTQAAAEAVARSLSGAVIMANGAPSDHAQVTVVTGTDFSVNKPVSAQRRSTTLASGATTTPTATTSAGTTPGSFNPPTPAAEALQPWDPRSCNAAGGAGP
jgi:LCP family protein required for cell wall assembly